MRMTPLRFSLLLVTLLLPSVLLSGCGSDGYTPATEISWVTLPEGHTYMGTFDDSAVPTYPDELPLHTVYFNAFQMSRTEVTNYQYAQFLNKAIDEGYIFATATKIYGAVGDYIGYLYLDLAGSEGTDAENRSHIVYDGSADEFVAEEGYEEWPVTFVTWYGAYAFGRFYYEFYEENITLPTEAEWEYAAHGGEDVTYPTEDGTISCDLAHYDCTGVDHPVATKSYDDNPFKIYDLGGNVREWCWDWYDADFYADSAASSPVNLSGTEPEADASVGDGNTYDTRILRGGSFASGEATLRAAARDQAVPFLTDGHTGFRVVFR